MKAGPEYNFSSKAASLNCVIFMTISLGTAFPYFYGIALFAIVVQYIVERYSLAVFYKLPTKFSLDITHSNLFGLTACVLINICLTFWMMGNKHMFSSDIVEPFQTIERIDKSHHYFFETIGNAFILQGFEAENLCFIFMLLFIFVLVGVIIRHQIDKKNREKNFGFDPQQTHEPPTFYEALRNEDLEEMIEEERVFIEDLKTQNMSEESLKKADTVLDGLLKHKPNKKRIIISGEPYYQIHKNFDYWLKFNLNIASEERNVRVLLNLPLIHPSQHHAVNLVSHRIYRQRDEETKRNK